MKNEKKNEPTKENIWEISTFTLQTKIHAALYTVNFHVGKCLQTETLLRHLQESDFATGILYNLVHSTSSYQMFNNLYELLISHSPVLANISENWKGCN